MTIKAIASCRGTMRHCDHRRAICRPAGGNVNSEFTIFAGNANPTLAAAIARELGAQLGSCVVDLPRQLKKLMDVMAGWGPATAMSI
jgi:hypothetical protein